VSEAGIAAVVWLRDQPFSELFQALLVASASHEILLVADQDVNVATLRSERARDVLSSFKNNPRLSLIYGEEPNFVFARSKALLTVLPVLRSNPPQDFRHLVKFFRDSPFCRGSHETKWLPLRFGKLLGSASFAKAMDRRAREAEQQAEDELRRIIEGLKERHPEKVRPILEDLGQEALREIRTSDTQWKLEWIRRRLAREGYSSGDRGR
jgi:hypothetical protein